MSPANIFFLLIWLSCSNSCSGFLKGHMLCHSSSRTVVFASKVMKSLCLIRDQTMKGRSSWRRGLWPLEC